MSPTTSPDRRLVGPGLCLGCPPTRPPTGRPQDDVLVRAGAAARAAERAGFTSLWVPETSADAADGVPFEAYSLLGALAVRTDAVHLGVVAEGDHRRAPSVLAKIVTGVDVISHGRAVLTLDGDRSEPADARRLREALAVARAVLEDDRPTVDGAIYSVKDAFNRPSPVQAGGVPLVVFLHGSGDDDDVLAACASGADAVVAAGGAGEVRRAVSFLARWSGERSRPGGRAAVLGRVTAVDGVAVTATEVAAVRDAGADGCLLELPAPWSAQSIDELAPTW